MEAVLLEPMGVAHNGIERLEVAGEAVLVIGCGPVGLFAIACAKALGRQHHYPHGITPKRVMRGGPFATSRLGNAAPKK